MERKKWSNLRLSLPIDEQLIVGLALSPPEAYAFPFLSEINVIFGQSHFIKTPGAALLLALALLTGCNGTDIAAPPSRTGLFVTDGCGPDDGSLGNVELGWLAAQFDDARSRGHRVWLLGHIPPGIDAPSTAQNSAKGVLCPAAITPFYAADYSPQLCALFEKNRDILPFGIFAHEHDDDFRVARDSAGKLLFGMKLVPAVTDRKHFKPEARRPRYALRPRRPIPAGPYTRAHGRARTPAPACPATAKRSIEREVTLCARGVRGTPLAHRAELGQRCAVLGPSPAWRFSDDTGGSRRPAPVRA